MKVFVCILAACLIANGVVAELGYAYAPPISTAPVHQHHHHQQGASSQQVATSYQPPASGSNYNQHQHHHVQQQQHVQQQVQQVQQVQQLPALTVAQTYQPAPVQQQQYTQTFSAPAPVQQQQQFVQQTYSAPAPVQQQQFTQTFSAPAQQQSFLSGSSSSNHYTAQSSHSVPTIVQKHIYVHVPPPDTEADAAAAAAQQQFVQPKKHYKIIFIKAPAQQSALPSPAALAQAQAATEEKTIVYVLVKKPDEQADYEAAASALPQAPPSKPEVYFIKYKNQAVAQQQQAGASLGVDVRNTFAGASIVGQEQELSGSAATLTGFTGITAPVQQQQTIITTTSQQHSHSHSAGETLATSQSQQAGVQQSVQVPAPVYGPVH